MQDDKLIFIQSTKKTPVVHRPFMIWEDEHTLLKSISEVTGLSMPHVLSIMLNFAAERIEIIENIKKEGAYAKFKD